MTAQEQRDHDHHVRSVDTALMWLEHVPEDEDIAVAKARLEEWLAANKGRWTRSLVRPVL